MHLYASSDCYIIKADFGLLRCSREDGKLTAFDAGAVSTSGLTCVGQVHGVVGRLPSRGNASTSSPGGGVLLAIAEWTQVGLHPFRPQQYGAVYRIDRVVALPLTQSSSGVDSSPSKLTAELKLRKCGEHDAETLGEPVKVFSSASTGKLSALQKSGQQKLKNTLGSFIGAASTSTQKRDASPPEKSPRSPAPPSPRMSRRDDSPSRDRVLDDVLDMFNVQRSFYVCPAGDLTCSLLRWVDKASEFGFEAVNSDETMKFVDQRFFWNQHALADLLNRRCFNMSTDDPDEGDSPTSETQLTLPRSATKWIMPMIQGFYRQIVCEFKLHNGMSVPVKLSLLSRRNVHRAGQRYIKRGIDDQANCANFVESEQTIEVAGHCLSFSLVRASVPLYWSQRGYKYRPLPQIDRPVNDSLPIYAEHINSLLTRYGTPLVMVNLVDQTGREKLLGESFLQHVLEMDNDEVTYVAFDYHEHCRGMRMDRINTLVGAMLEPIRRIGFTWLDDRGLPICKQSGVFRINCVDCLDRTNVAQSALAHAAFELKLNKLGILSPRDEADSLVFSAMPANVHTALNHVWADNGDQLSMQYAGTAALKGDVTRTTQRSWTGMLKDGYNSASRYYLCHVRDNQKQAAIDYLLGNTVAPPPSKLPTQELANAQAAQVHEELRQLVQECEHFFLPASEYKQLLGAWAMIDADTTKDALLQLDMDMNTVLMLTRRAFYVCRYDDEQDKFDECHRVALQDITSIQYGPLHAQSSVTSLLTSVGKDSVSKEQRCMTCLRIYYKCTELMPSAKSSSSTPSAYFYTFRPASTRLFNNMALALKNREEADEYAMAIAEQFVVACQVSEVNPPIALEPVAKLERLKPRVPGAPVAASGLNNKLGSALTFFSAAGQNLKKNINNMTSVRKRTGHELGVEASSDEEDDVLIVMKTNESGINTRAVVSSEAGLLFHRAVVSDVVSVLDISSNANPISPKFFDDHQTFNPPSNVSTSTAPPAVKIQVARAASNQLTAESSIPTALRARSPLIDFTPQQQHQPLRMATSLGVPGSGSLKACASDSQLNRHPPSNNPPDLHSAHPSPPESPDQQGITLKPSGGSRRFLSNLGKNLTEGIDKTTSSFARLSAQVYATGGKTLRMRGSSGTSLEQMKRHNTHAFGGYMGRIEMSRSTFVLL